MMRILGRGIFWACLLVSQLPAQQAAPPPTLPADDIRPTYVLGPGDQVVIRAFQVEEIGDKPYRLSEEGDVTIPLLGKVHAGGLTISEFEAELVKGLAKLVVNPQVTVSVVQYRSAPVFVTGYFKNDGIIPLQGRRTLLEVLTSVGGVQPNASRKIRVTRHLEQGAIPLPNAVTDPTRKISTVEISLASLRGNLNPEEDIVLQPMDTIFVDREELIYASGEVARAGGVELGERDSLSIIQLMAMVGGTTKDAAVDKAVVLRKIFDTSQRGEIPVDLKKVLAGKERDFPLLPGDVLYVPRSGAKINMGRVGMIAIPLVTGIIYVMASKL